MSLKPFEMVAVGSVLRDFKSIVKNFNSSASVHVVGSYSSGLATPTSDLDLKISLPSFDKDPLSRGPSPGGTKGRKASRKSFNLLQSALRRSPSFDKVQLRWGRLQILNTVHCKTGLEVQIQFTPTSPVSLQYIATYLSEFPTLRPLFILLRSALEIRGLRNTQRAGLGSYPIFIMMVYALNRSASEVPRHNIAAQLLYILKLYSEADLQRYGFSVNPPNMFNKSIVGMKNNATARQYGIDVMDTDLYRSKSRQRSLLCLQDPADPSNNLGRFARPDIIKQVQELFYSAREQIEQAMNEWEKMTESERQNVNWGCLDPLVRTSYAHLEEKRSKVERTLSRAEGPYQDLLEELFKDQNVRKDLWENLRDRIQ